MQQPAVASVPGPVKAPRLSAVLRMLRQAEIGLQRFARHRLLACCVVALMALGLRAALLPVFPIPKPIIQDEFSYILGGETFARGRLANPPHPMWQFFETMHVNMHPTYASKYPPAQAAFLALGIRLFGHPWYGVWLSMGLLCGALCWMLQGWLPPKYGLIGGLLTILQLGVTGSWINSFWGGAVAALGGALAIGALPRLARRPGAAAATAAAAGILILANSRPFEGAILIALLGFALLWWAWRRRNLGQVLRLAVVAPVLIGLGLTAASAGYYNWKVSGDVRLLPYVLNTRQYHWSPPLWFLPVTPPPARFRDAAMQGLWAWDHDIHVKAQQNPLRVPDTLNAAVFSTFVDAPGLVFIPIVLAGLLLVSAPRARLATVLLGAFLFLSLSEQCILAHYLAPGLGLLLLPAMSGLQLFRTMKVRGAAIGLPLVAMILFFSSTLFLNDMFKRVLSRPPATDAMAFRFRTLERLNHTPGRHLVMVRYGADHNFLQEHVYNGPDIDAQKVIWALDRGVEDQALFAYFRGRIIWLFEPDGPVPSLRPWR